MIRLSAGAIFSGMVDLYSGRLYFFKHPFKNEDMEGNNLTTGNYIMIQDEIRQKIDKLNVSEKILLVSDIWGSIAQDCSAMPPIQGWQKKELDQRIEEYESGKAELFDWKEVHNELREEFK